MTKSRCLYLSSAGELKPEEGLPVEDYRGRGECSILKDMTVQRRLAMVCSPERHGALASLSADGAVDLS
jgi:hypothetical protein